MSYEIDYVTLPVFTSKSIGYTINNAGSYILSSQIQNNTIYNVCSFSLGIGVYMLTVNMYDLTPISGYWNISISDTPTSFGTKITNSVAGLISCPYILSNTTSGTKYVVIQSVVFSTSPSSTITTIYNCSIVRIA